MGTPRLDQFAFYNDDGSDTTSTLKAAQNTNISVDPAGGNLTVQLRLGIQETTGSTGVSANLWRLQVSKNGGAYANIATSPADVGAANSANLVNGTVISAGRLTGLSGTFNTGEVQNNAATTASSKGISAGNWDEFVWAIQITAAGIAIGDTYDFKVLYAGADLTGGYTVTPRITVASAGGGAQTINAGLTTNSQSFYAEQLNLTLYGGLATNGQSYYGPKLNLSVNPALATNNQAFYSFTVTQPGLQTVNAPLVTNVSVTFGPDVQGYVPPDPRNMAFTIGRPLAGFHHQNPFGRFR